MNLCLFPFYEEVLLFGTHPCAMLTRYQLRPHPADYKTALVFLGYWSVMKVSVFVSQHLP